MKKLICVLTIMSCLFINSNVFAKELESRVNIDTTRVFAFKFSKAMDINSLKNNIYVLDENNNIAETKLLMDDSNKIVYIVPTVEYKPGTAYRMIINTDIKTTDGEKYLKENIYMNFITKMLCPYSLEATQQQI